MSTPRKMELRELAPNVFRDHATDERVDRVWERLRDELPETSSRATRLAWWPIAAAAALVFASGVFVGRWSNSSGGSIVAAEPPASLPAARGPQATAAQRRAQSVDSARARARGGVSRQVANPLNGVEAEGVIGAPPLEPPAVQGPSEAEWERLAADPDNYTEAWRALDAVGGFDEALKSASADQLTKLADIARFNSQRGRALQALRLLLDRFPNAQEAPEAAWALGNMLESQGDVPRALEAFALYRRLSPHGDFVEDAASRPVKLAIEQGDLQKARELLDRYAKEFPNGGHLAELQSQLAGLTSDVGPRDENQSKSESSPAPSLDPSAAKSP